MIFVIVCVGCSDRVISSVSCRRVPYQFPLLAGPRMPLAVGRLNCLPDVAVAVGDDLSVGQSTLTDCRQCRSGVQQSCWLSTWWPTDVFLMTLMLMLRCSWWHGHRALVALSPHNGCLVSAPLHSTSVSSSMCEVQQVASDVCSWCGWLTCSPAGSSFVPPMIRNSFTTHIGIKHIATCLPVCPRNYSYIDGTIFGWFADCWK